MSICFDNSQGVSENDSAVTGMRVLLRPVRRLERSMTTDVSQIEVQAAGQLPVESVDQLAAKALKLVASRQRRAGGGPIAQLVVQLQKAVTTGGTADAQVALRHMIGSGVRPEDIADNYIPAVARRLGDLWCEDEVGFATVTIGVARLQGMLRDLEDLAGMQRDEEPEGAALLVVVAAGVYHTLGAMVLTGQLRRQGHAVRLMLGAEPDAVAVAVRQARFDMVMVSSAEGAPAEGVRRLVHAVKNATGTPPPVVIGGTVLETAAEIGADILTLTGADHATCDPNEALRLCGLTTDTCDGLDRGQGS
jgi:methanogenic corrinoid protein MtbC1